MGGLGAPLAWAAWCPDTCAQQHEDEALQTAHVCSERVAKALNCAKPQPNLGQVLPRDSLKELRKEDTVRTICTFSVVGTGGGEWGRLWCGHGEHQEPRNRASS